MDVLSDGAVPLRNFPDVFGMVGCPDSATESCVLQGRDAVVFECLFRTAGVWIRTFMM